MQDFNQLTKTMLYKMQNVKLKKNWKEDLERKNENIDNSEQSPSDTDLTSDTEQDYPCETLIHGFPESRYIHKIQDKIIEIAPAQDQ